MQSHGKLIKHMQCRILAQSVLSFKTTRDQIGSDNHINRTQACFHNYLPFSNHAPEHS